MNAWIHQLDLRIEPVGFARCQLIVARRAVPRRAALHTVGDEDLFSLEAETAQHLVHEAPGSAEEWTSFGLFLGSGRLTNEHEARRERSFARHRPRATFTEAALYTAPNASMDCVKLTPSPSALRRPSRVA